MARGRAMRKSAPLTIQLAVRDQHPGAHRHRGVVPLLLEEPDPGGQHGHRPAGQGHEGVGQLEGHASGRRAGGRSPSRRW